MRVDICVLFKGVNEGTKIYLIYDGNCTIFKRQSKLVIRKERRVNVSK